jgi:hypothetical protein
MNLHPSSAVNRSSCHAFRYSMAVLLTLRAFYHTLRAYYQVGFTLTLRISVALV